jgi:hypothetical protein
MIQIRPPSEDLEKLVGRIIFHLSRGVHFALTPVGSASSGARPVGEMLGKVSRVSGPNRIFYEDLSGSERYVSVGGIGFVCDTEAEAQQLEELRQKTATDVEQALAQVRQRLEEQVVALVRRTTA